MSGKLLQSILIGSAITVVSTTIFADPALNEDGVLVIKPNAPKNPDAKNPLVHPKQNADRIRVRSHNGIGPEVSIENPKIILDNVRIRFDRPDGVDENGNPITYQERQERALIRKLTGKILKERQEAIREGRLPNYTPESQLEVWKRKTAETKEYIKKHGPITSKHFTRPGMTPQESDRYYLPSTRVAYRDGKFIPVYDENDPEAQKITHSPAFLEKQKKLDQMKAQIEANGVRRTPIEQVRVVRQITGIDNAQDAFARGQAPQTMTIDEVAQFGKSQEQNTEESRPANRSDSSGKSEEELLKEQFPDAFEPQSSLTESLFRFLLGVKDAQANPDFSIEKNKNIDKFKSGVIGLNPRLQGNEFDEFAEEARRQQEEVTNRFDEKKKEQSDKDCLTCGPMSVKEAERVFSAFKKEKEREKRVSPKKSLKDFTQASRTVRDLTRKKDISRYEKDSQELLANLNDPAYSGSLYQSLKSTLRAHPEIRDHMPDVDERLEAIRLGQEKALAKMTEEEKKAYQITYIFVSYSMGDTALGKIFRDNAGKDDTQIVMRGFPEGMTFAQGLNRFKKIAQEEKLTVMPNFSVDPPLFQLYGITQVPTVVRAQDVPNAIASVAMKRTYPTLIAKVSGLASDVWLKERIEDGEIGDLGNRGNLFTIAEPDLIEVIKAKIASVDWDKKREEAFNRYWVNQKFDVLPLAEITREVRIDPSFEVPDDIKDLAGNFIYAKGDRVNPLDMRTFTDTVLIFNPTRPEELERVDAYLREHNQAKLKKPIFVLTEINKSKGWDEYTAICDRFDSHMFFMVPEFKKVWGVKATPSVIWADNEAKEFALRELGPVNKEKH